ncbi:MAG: peptide-methionine (S)-S-oxide reductase MsrA [Hoeflea sp.]|uniref:peptide-methionine (S)-S-oxide reductase MsrA n=1 Tax=Hoeflea sp. TaxID=1940281 RepID=UPI0032EDD37D
MFLIDMFNRKTTMPAPAEILPGRPGEIATAQDHALNARPLKGPFDERLETAIVAMGQFWGAERLFWNLDGVEITAVGYAGGTTPNPTHQEVLTGLTGHAQAVKIVFDPAKLDYRDLLALFFESHDPSQGMRQGSDIGTFFRSAIFTSDDGQLAHARAAADTYGSALSGAGREARITTEIRTIDAFYYAEAHHQQYLFKNPSARSGLKPSGVAFPRSSEI